jgi:hypothetical protein
MGKLFPSLASLSGAARGRLLPAHRRTHQTLGRAVAAAVARRQMAGRPWRSMAAQSRCRSHSCSSSFPSSLSPHLPNPGRWLHRSEVNGGGCSRVDGGGLLRSSGGGFYAFRCRICGFPTHHPRRGLSDWRHASTWWFRALRCGSRWQGTAARAWRCTAGTGEWWPAPTTGPALLEKY